MVVRAKKQDDSVIFFVEDNGVGMPDSAPSSIIATPNGSVSIGLYNINTRLIRMYGRGLSIKSESGVGTSVSFEIPLRKDE